MTGRPDPLQLPETGDAMSDAWLEGFAVGETYGLAQRSGLAAFFVGMAAGVVAAGVIFALVLAAPRSSAGTLPPPGDVSRGMRALAGDVATLPTTEAPRPSTPAVVGELDPAARSLVDTAPSTPAQPFLAEPSDVVLDGIASHMGSSYPASYLALPWGPGVTVEICGPAACVVMTSTDAGPSLAMQRDGRVADLSVAVFEKVCGCSRRMGLVPVTVTRVAAAELTLPPTETAP